MTVQLPEAAPRGSSWYLIDYMAPDALSVKADNTGLATIKFPAVDADRMWQITRAVIANTGVIVVPLRLYVVNAGSDVSPAALRSGSGAGLFDEADYPGDGLWVQSGEQLVAQWVGVTPGSTSTCSLQYRLLGR